MRLPRTLRFWLVRRRIDRILREAGCTANPTIFTGNVIIDETRFSNYYTANYSEPA